MESFWKKELVDGTIELGTDTMVSLGQASWTKGRQDITQVMLFFSGRLVSVRSECPDKCRWRVLDHNVCSAITGKDTRIERIIEVEFEGEKDLELKKIDVLSEVRHTVFELVSKKDGNLNGYTKALIGIDHSGTLQVRLK